MEGGGGERRKEKGRGEEGRGEEKEGKRKEERRRDGWRGKREEEGGKE